MTRVLLFAAVWAVGWALWALLIVRHARARILTGSQADRETAAPMSEEKLQRGITDLLNRCDK